MSEQWHRTGKILIATIVIVVVCGAVMIALALRHGLSSRAEPTLMEETIARSARHFATPLAMRKRTNPVRLTDNVMAEARAHWADHCATCHANDGSGQTEIGHNLYPRS